MSWLDSPFISLPVRQKVGHILGRTAWEGCTFLCRSILSEHWFLGDHTTRIPDEPAVEEDVLSDGEVDAEACVQEPEACVQEPVLPSGGDGALSDAGQFVDDPQKRGHKRTKKEKKKTFEKHGRRQVHPSSFNWGEVYFTWNAGNESWQISCCPYHVSERGANTKTRCTRTRKHRGDATLVLLKRCALQWASAGKIGDARTAHQALEDQGPKA